MKNTDTLKSAFPNEVDLAREVPDYDNAPVSPVSGKKQKMRKSYPILYIENVQGLESMPKEGYALIYYRRKSLNLRENNDGEDTTGADLEVQQISLPEVSKSEEDADMAEALSAFASEKGISDTGHAEPDGDEDAEGMEPEGEEEDDE